MVEQVLESARERLATTYRRLRGVYLDVRSRLELWAGRERVALASYPRSGNTWVRGLLEEATGERTGSVYRDVVMPRGSHGVAIKTHERDRHRYSRTIPLVRDPRDVVVSYDHWKRDIAGVEVDWEEHVTECLRGWRRHTEHWLSFQGPRMEVRFEALKAEPAETLRRVGDFLDRPLDPETAQAAVEATQLDRMRDKVGGEDGERFFRKGKTGEGRRELDERDRERVEDTAGELLERFDYEAST